MGKIIELKEISYYYPKTNNYAINKININIESNQFIAIIGPNGSGKTTLAKLLNGLLIPSSGVVLIDNLATSDSGEKLWEIRNKVGIVFQNPDNQIVANTVEDDIAFGLENQGIDSVEIRKRVNQVLKELDILSLRLVEPQNLSGGQKRKVAIAGILAMKPKVIILDEATSMLDPKSKKEILNIIKELCEKEKITIIHITNIVQEALMADRIIVMDNGQILIDDIPEKVFEKRDMLLKIGLEVPNTIELAHRLRKKGYAFKRNLLCEEEFVEELWTLF